MTERLENLRAALQDLEHELDSLETVDPETRAALEHAKAEIKEALEREDTARLQEQSQSLVERLKDAEQEFEASHPTLSGVVMRIINALAQLGI